MSVEYAHDGIVEFIDEVADLLFRTVVIERSGARMHQHVHDYDHATVCGSGRAILYVDGTITRIVEAGEVVLVKANKEHYFEALAPKTRLICVHDPASAESIRKKGL